MLKFYPASFLDRSMTICLALAIFYSLWSMDKNTSVLYDSEYLIFTVPIVILIVLKYSLDIDKESDGDPVEALLHDTVLLSLCGVYILSMFLILYL